MVAPTEKFSLGQVVATANLMHELEARYNEGTQLMLLLMLRRHQSGDWGDTCAEDAQANEAALKFGNRILSIYHPEPESDPNFTIWIITERDRSVTTVMLDEDY